MGQLVLTLVFILISSLLLASEKYGHIKCEMIGSEHKVYLFDITANKYNLSLIERGRSKSTVSRQIQKVKPLARVGMTDEYHFEIDDNTQVQVKVDPETGKGKGELIQNRFPTRVKAFSKCEVYK